jgi:EAL domain-containing protein (putative c-di-GMP-specific phosphodiesterase class I)
LSARPGRLKSRPGRTEPNLIDSAIIGVGTAIEAVETLNRAGIRIALDDFGTGHSSLGLLRTVPVDVLKKDASSGATTTGPAPLR